MFGAFVAQATQNISPSDYRFRLVTASVRMGLPAIGNGYAWLSALTAISFTLATDRQIGLTGRHCFQLACASRHGKSVRLRLAVYVMFAERIRRSTILSI